MHGISFFAFINLIVKIAEKTYGLIDKHFRKKYEIIKYEMDKTACLTKCPYKEGLVINGVYCKLMCKYMKGHDSKKQTVKCNYKYKKRQE